MIFKVLIGLSILSAMSTPAYGIIGGKAIQSSDPDFHMVQHFRIRTGTPERDPMCTGTLISPRILLTAAHCVYKQNPEIRFELQIASGSMDVVGKVLAIHPNYNPNTHHKDLALIQLSENVPDNAFIARLPKSRADLPSLPAKTLAYGYGRLDGFTNQPFNNSPMLPRKVALETTKIENDRYVQDQRNGRGTAQGDSGGPLFYVNERNEYILIAVVSTSRGIARDGIDEKHPQFNAANYDSSHEAVFPEMSWLRKYVRELR